jgi:hypothetical protein
MVVLGWFATTSCGSDEAPKTTPPVIVTDAAADVPGDVPVEPTPCNLAEPSCPDPAFPKCSIADAPEGYASVCVPESGTRAVGESCQRERFGYDDCATGAACTSVAQAADAASELACRTVCITPAQCEAPERCYRFSLNQPEIYGLCVPVCQPLDTACGTGRHCIFVLDADRDIFAICDSHGDLPEGASCATPQQCGRDMACVDGNFCRPYCDETRPCTTPGRTCRDIGIAAFPGLGVCLPT